MSTTATRGNFVFGVVFVGVFAALLWWRSGGGSADIPASQLAAFSQNLSLASAKERSAESGRPVFVYATASWCGPCRAFKADTLSQDRVAQVLSNRFEPVYLDVDKAAADARSLRITVVPTLMIFRDGIEVDRRQGGMATQEFIDWLGTHAPQAPAAP